jgi:hypothetical protein
MIKGSHLYNSLNMTEALAVQTRKSAVHLVARNPVEMQTAQADLAEWLKRKIDSFDPEITALNASINEAKTNGWSVTALTRQRNKEVARQEFYAKVLAAVEAGYTVVPEFPVDMFAIRVLRDYPKGGRVESRYGAPALSAEAPDILPPGYGEYFSNMPTGERGSYQKQIGDGKTETIRYADADQFSEVVFPIRAARPEVMSATAEAMALKVFDQIGICPAERKADPLIIGQVLGKKEGYSQKCVNFLIAWHLNLNEL